MKKALFFVALTLLGLAVIAGLQEYREQVAQYCGNSAEHIRRVDWVWEWWPNRDHDKSFVDCVGPSEYIAYRPLDIAGLLLVASGACFIVGSRVGSETKK